MTLDIPAIEGALAKDHDFGHGRVVQVAGGTKTEFALALALALANCPGGSPTHYISTPDRLAFFWHEDGATVALPFKMSLELLIKFSLEWLLKSAKYPDEPDTDGSSKHGFEITTDIPENTGWHYGVCAVKPAWMIYGK
jgi:hypothetical protein